MLFSSWNTLIRVFATLFVLSYVKFIDVVTDSMIPTSVYDMNGKIHQFPVLIQWLYHSVRVTYQLSSSQLSFSSLFCYHQHFCYCSIPLPAFEDSANVLNQGGL